MKLVYEGKLSAGLYEIDMYPVFVDGFSLSEIIKDILCKKGLDSNFCFLSYLVSSNSAKNLLIGKKVKLTLEVSDID